MKAICPISGVPFRTYDSLPNIIPYHHPIFSLSFDELTIILDVVRQQEEAELKRTELISEEERNDLEYTAKIKDLTNRAVEAIHEKNYKNPAFKLYQTKHLTMLAFMRMADLIENEAGFVARPSPQIIEAYYWTAIELFAWACTIRNPQIANELPKYRISDKNKNENMENFSAYLDILTEVKESIGSRYRSRADEQRIVSLARAIAILSKRRDVYKTAITSGTNHLAAKWALMVTRPPKDIVPFWYGILSSTSVKITFEGVKINDTWQKVTQGDLRELRDFLMDNLISPRGEHKQTHLDDSEYYFMARKTCLDIINRHIAIIEQGTATYQIVNAALGDQILTASDDVLERKGLAVGLEAKPDFSLYGTKIALLQAMAKWRLATRQALIEIANKETVKIVDEVKKDGGKFEIL